MGGGEGINNLNILNANITIVIKKNIVQKKLQRQNNENTDDKERRKTKRGVFPSRRKRIVK